MRKLLVTGAMLLSLCVPTLALAQTAAQSYGLEATGQAAYGSVPTAAKSDISKFVGTYVVKPILGVVGLAFFVLMIYGGVLWMVAAGNETMVKKAQEILKSAFIGTVIVVASYAITNAIFNALTTGDVNTGS
ncbi:hypothetical protein HYS28_01920 [Candidatus Uhrbacteria bacterium]|nr:hypothetical protein [Candidatus Uhrbacteria bacterium]